MWEYDIKTLTLNHNTYFLNYIPFIAVGSKFKTELKTPLPFHRVLK